MKNKLFLIFGIIILIVGLIFFIFNVKDYSLTGDVTAVFFEDTDTEFNLGTFINTSVEGTGVSANITLNKTSPTGKSTINFTASAVNGTNTLEHRLSNIAIGTADANRKVVVGVVADHNTQQKVINITIGGVNTSLVVEAGHSNGRQPEIWQADVPTGITADIVITWNASATQVGIGVWAIYDAASNAHDTNVSHPPTGTAPSGKLNILSDGVALSISMADNSATWTWSNLTENYDETVESSVVQSGASGNFTNFQTNLTITATPSSTTSNNLRMVSASWGPSYEILGNFTSQILDSSNTNTNWTNISWTQDLELNISTRTSSNATTWSAWSDIYTINTNQTIKGTSQARYLQYRVDFNISDNSITPKLLDVSVYYEISLTIIVDSPLNQTYTTSNIDYNITLSGNLHTAYYSIDESSNSTMNNDSNTHYFNLSSNHPALLDGFHNITFWINDTLGNSNETTVFFTIDSTPPTLFIHTSYTNATPKKNTEFITLNISVIDSISGLTGSICLVDANGTNQSILVSNGWCNSSTIALTNQEDRNKRIVIYVNDTLNNRQLNNTRYVQVDTTNPVSTATCPTGSTETGASFPCTCSGSDVTSGVSSSIGTTTSPDGTSSVSSTGSFTYTCTVEDNAGNSLISTATYDVVQSGSGSSSSGSSSGGGGSGTTTSTDSNIFTKITPGVVSIMKNFGVDIGVKEIKIEVNNEAQNVKITVSKFNGKPVSVSLEKTGKVYQYIEIKTENINDKLDKATVTIKVEKSWVSENLTRKEDVSLFKFNESSNIWNELLTTYKEEDDTYFYYDVELTSFSFFAISEKTIVVVEDEEEKEEIVTGTPSKDAGKPLNKGLIVFWSLFSTLIFTFLILSWVFIRLIKPKEEYFDHNKITLKPYRKLEEGSKVNLLFDQSQN